MRLHVVDSFQRLHPRVCWGMNHTGVPRLSCCIGCVMPLHRHIVDPLNVSVFLNSLTEHLQEEL